MGNRKPKVFTAADGLTVEDLIRGGLDHLSAATRLLEGNARHFDSAGYVAHLGFELIMKGWHLHVRGEFEGGHSLLKLWADLPGVAWAVMLTDREKDILQRLDRYKELRYPNVNDPVEVGGDDVPLIRELLEAVFRSLPDEIRNMRFDPKIKGGRMLMERPE